MSKNFHILGLVKSANMVTFLLGWSLIFREFKVIVQINLEERKGASILSICWWRKFFEKMAILLWSMSFIVNFLFSLIGDQ